MADNINVTPGSGAVVAAELLSNSTIALVQRIKMVIGDMDVDGGDVASDNPMPISGSTTVLSMPAITGSVSIIGTPTITGSTSVINVVSITGSTSILSMPSITGSTSVVNTVAITGSTTISSMPSVTGSVSVLSIPSITGSVSVLNAVSVGVTSLPSITGSVTVVSMPTITVQTNSVITILPSITGSVSVLNVVSITGSVTLSSTLGTVSLSGIIEMGGLYTTTQSTTANGSTGSIQITSAGAQIVATGVDSFTITGSTTIASMPAITGSVSLLAASRTFSTTGNVTITGSVTVIGTSSITGSVTRVNIQYPSSSTIAFTVSAAATSILIPSTAANSIYITDVVISNANTAGSILLGYATGSVAPTTTAIKIGPLYFAANGGCVWPIQNPIKLPSSSNFVCTAASAGTMTATITYYVSP